MFEEPVLPNTSEQHARLEWMERSVIPKTQDSLVCVHFLLLLPPTPHHDHAMYGVYRRDIPQMRSMGYNVVMSHIIQGVKDQ